MRPEDIDGLTVGTLRDLVYERYPVTDSGKIQKYRPERGWRRHKKGAGSKPGPCNDASGGPFDRRPLLHGRSRAG